MENEAALVESESQIESGDESRSEASRGAARGTSSTSLCSIPLSSPSLILLLVLVLYFKPKA